MEFKQLIHFLIDIFFYIKINHAIFTQVVFDNFSIVLSSNSRQNICLDIASHLDIFTLYFQIFSDVHFVKFNIQNTDFTIIVQKNGYTVTFDESISTSIQTIGESYFLQIGGTGERQCQKVSGKYNLPTRIDQICYIPNSSYSFQITDFNVAVHLGDFLQLNIMETFTLDLGELASFSNVRIQSSLDYPVILNTSSSNPIIINALELSGSFFIEIDLYKPLSISSQLLLLDPIDLHYNEFLLDFSHFFQLCISRVTLWFERV